jgi:peptidoglycan/xylan/chitin deacetylase (PgdA/CDA1 family)
VGACVTGAFLRGERVRLIHAVRKLSGSGVPGTDVASLTRQLCEAMKLLPSLEREERVSALEAEFGAAAPSELPRYLSWEGVRTLAAAGWEIGSHTRTHPILPRLPEEELGPEIEESRKEIIQALGALPVGFAYPNGDCDDKVAQKVRAVGFEYAVVAMPHQAVEADPYRIARRCISEQSSRGYATAFSEGAFLAEVEGALDRFRR